MKLNLDNKLKINLSQSMSEKDSDRRSSINKINVL